MSVEMRCQPPFRFLLNSYGFVVQHEMDFNVQSQKTRVNIGKVRHLVNEDVINILVF